MMVDAHVTGSAPRHDGGVMLDVRLQPCGSSVTVSAPVALSPGASVRLEPVGSFWRLVREGA